MNVVKEIQRINDKELELGVAGTSASWHDEYCNSAWVFAGNLPFSLSEGDVLCVFSQWGEIEDMHLVRDEDTGKSKGYAFIKYEDQRSTVLAVDNFNGITVRGQEHNTVSSQTVSVAWCVCVMWCTCPFRSSCLRVLLFVYLWVTRFACQILDRTLRVDHKMSYQPPKKKKEKDDDGNTIAEESEDELAVKEHVAGHAYEGKELANEYSLQRGVDVFAPVAPSASAGVSLEQRQPHKRGKKEGHKKKKKEKKAKKESKKKHKKHEKKSHKKHKRSKHHRRSGASSDADDVLQRAPKRARLDADGAGVEAKQAGSHSWRGRNEPTGAAGAGQPSWRGRNEPGGGAGSGKPSWRGRNDPGGGAGSGKPSWRGRNEPGGGAGSGKPSWRGRNEAGGTAASRKPSWRGRNEPR